MSEFLAEAQVLIAPNTVGFAAALRAQLAKAVAEVGPVVIPVTTAGVATGGVSAALKEETAALQTVGAEQTQVGTSASTLARAQAAAALAAQKLAFSEEEVAGAASAVSAAQVTLTRSTAAVAAAQKAVGAAVLANNAELISATNRTLALAEAQAVEAEAALTAARAQAKHAVSLSQLGRGAGATGLSFLGLRGATLAASGAFLAGAASVVIAAKSIGAASDQTEQLNKSVEVFAGSAPAIEAWAKTTATSLGISETAALGAASTFGELFRTLGIGPRQAAGLSESLVKLAADLASFNNVSTERALTAIQSGLVGQARPLRALGVFLTAARVQEEALAETGKKLATELTQQDKILARTNLTFKDAAIQQGDFERTSGRLANQSRILTAQVTDLAAVIGHTLLPAITDIVITANAAVTGLRKLGAAKIVPGGPDTTNLLGWVGGWKELGFVWDHSIFPGLFKMDKEVTIFDGIAKNTVLTLNSLAAAFAKVADASAAPSAGQKSGLALSLAQSSGNQAQELALLEEKARKQEAFLESQLGKPQTSKRVALEKKASDNLTQTNAQIQRILDQRASDSAKASSDQKQAIADAAKAQAEATQAFIDAFSGKHDRLENRLSTAQLSGTANTQIAINKAIIVADKNEISAIKDRIRHLKLHGDALKAAKAAIATLTQEIFNTRNAIIQLNADRKQAIVDARQSHLEAQLAIAETTTFTKDDTAATRALIAFDNVQIARLKALKKAGKATRDEIAQLDAYRVDLAQRKQALKDLQKQNEDTSKAAKSFAFSFLQTQQGFAANLLGNLIPGFATGGLVGGGNGAAAAAGDPLRQVAGGFEQPRGSVEGMAAVAGSRDRGVRPVQVDTTNQLLRRILAALQGRPGHPEAHHQRQTATSSYYGPDHGF